MPRHISSPLQGQNGQMSLGGPSGGKRSRRPRPARPACPHPGSSRRGPICMRRFLRLIDLTQLSEVFLNRLFQELSPCFIQGERTVEPVRVGRAVLDWCE